MATMDALLRIRADVQGANGVVALGRSLQGVERAATTASVAMRGVQSAVGGLVGLVGGVAIFTKIFGDTATLQTQTRSLEVLLGSASKAGQIIKELQAYGSVTPFESTDLIETAKRLGAFGVVGQRVVEVTKRLGDIAGATGANLGELATAYGQVVSKGRLQTEELLQFQERGVGIQAELQKMYGLSGQELQKALSAGRVSSEAFEQAIVRLTEKGGKYANGAVAQSDTLTGRLSTLKDTVTALSQKVGGMLEPAMNRILLIATSIVDRINRAMGMGRAADLQGIAADGLSDLGNGRSVAEKRAAFQAAERLANAATPQKSAAGIEQNIGALQQAVSLLRRITAEGLDDRQINLLEGLGARLTDRIAKEEKLLEGLKKEDKPLKVPPLTGGTTGGGTGGKAGGGRAEQGLQGVYMQGGIGPSGPGQYGPHYDIKRVDGKYFPRGALDRYVSVNGGPLSAGTTVSGGQFGAMRDGGSRVHNAWDYAFGGDAKLSLKGGAKWTGTSKGSYGDNTAFQTPDGTVYRLIHGTFKATGKGAAADAWKDSAQMEEDQARADEKAKQEAKQADKQLTAARDLLFTNQALLQIDEARSPLQKATAEFDKERSDRMRYFADRLSDAKSEEEQRALVGAQMVAQTRAEIEYQEKLKAITGDQLDMERERVALLADSMARMEEMTTRNSLGAGAQQGIQAYVDSIGNLRDAMGQLTTTAIGGLEESLTSLATTGTANFREFAASILKDTTRMIIRQLILKSIMQLLGGIGGSATAKSFEMPSAAFIPSGGYSFAPSAMGNVFASNGIQPFAMGGIVNRPTLFPFAKGIGLMGEAGPEAIMPLRRGADGKLGVASSGGGSTTINISVDAKGSSVQGDNGQSAALARAIAGAVQTELIKQKRPGGILTS